MHRTIGSWKVLSERRRGEQDEKLEKVNPDAAWLARGIIVKVI